MEDELSNGVTEETESDDAMYFDDDDDPDWNNVKWGADDEDETPNAEGEDIDGTTDTDADHSEEKPAETDGPAEEPAAESAASDTDQYLELKHFNEVKKVGKDEAKVLAQKGLDYDNVRGERDSARSERDALKEENARYKDMEAFLNEMRGSNFGSIEDFMDDTRARIQAEKTGKSFDETLAEIKANRAPKEEAPKQEAAKPSPVDEFLRRYPGVKAEEIPESVWVETQQTGDLAGAYTKYLNAQKDTEIQRLKDEIETLKQNEKNRTRSAGSSRSSGAGSSKSLIEQLWNNGE